MREFDGSLAVAIARGAHAGDPLDAPLKILTPVSGNEQLRRGAELAMTLARAAGAEVTALLVISRGICGRVRALFCLIPVKNAADPARGS